VTPGNTGRSADVPFPAVEAEDQAAPAWVESVGCVPRNFYGSQTILGLFHEAAPDLSDRGTFVELVRGYLARHQELIETWQGSSYDKRSSPSPYVDGTEVGFFSGKRNSVTHHEPPLDAWADFIYRESLWVLDRQGGG
jgi:hypothetical protein